MTTYRAVLLLHLLALLAAVCAAAILHFAASRRLRAAHVSEALQWHRALHGTEKVFPIALVILVATGAWMVHDNGSLSWRLSWVDVGLAGAVVLMACGAAIGARQKRAGAQLQRLSSSPASAPPSIDPVAHLLGWTNSGIAIAVVCVMTLKPSAVGGICALVAGAACGAVIARTELASAAAERASALSRRAQNAA